jgi:cellulose synthase/poly-beta-1,6-N-acetylglucosamine synthase-like glycosyltransferase
MLQFKNGYAKPSPMHTEVLNLLTAVHFLSMAGLAVYGLHRIWMIRFWFKHPVNLLIPSDWQEEDMPRVTIQIPLYNEPRVAGRIIDSVAAIEWPGEKLQIQVLDDSDDDTRVITAERERYWVSKGRDITVIRRSSRTGYKAGALASGLERATGEFIAVFDADFVPKPDFLKKTMLYFAEEGVGMVQARWGFLNAGYSWLTRLQSLLLSAHFGIEHAVRYGRGLFFNFNGTAGVWRKSAITSAGGWQSDTVTEDLDLSYRAQLAGWRFVYLHDVEVPSELPVTLADFRCQQERWSKGAIQTARKLLLRVLAAPVPLAVKVETVAHLLANCCWVFGFLATLTLYPVLINRIGIGVYQMLWIDLPLFLLTGGAVLAYYLLYGWKSGLKQSLFVLPLLPAASIGLSPFFSFAVLKGVFRKGGVFARTPKFGILNSTRSKSFHTMVSRHTIWNLLTNLVLFVYTLMPVLFSLIRETWPAVPFLCLFPAGFLLIIACDCKECLSGGFKKYS